MPTDNEFERDFENVAGRRFPGRFDPREFNNVEDAGDGIPGLQKCFRNYLHEGGMEKDLDVNNNNLENVDEAAIATANIVAGNITTATITTANITTNNVTTENISGDLDVDGVANLDNTDIDGTLDVAGVTDLHDSLDMNNQDIEKVKNLDVDGNVDIEGDVDINGTTNLDDTDIDGTLDVAGEVDLHSDLDLHNGNLDDVATIDGGGNAVQVDDDISLPANNITLGAAQTVDGVDISAISLDNMPTACGGTVDVNSNIIDNVAQGSVADAAARRDELLEYSDIETLQISNDAEQTTDENDYVKLKEIIIYKNIETCLVKWEHRTTNSDNIVYSKIYINGVAYGAEKSTVSEAYEEVSQIITALYSGDQVQIYVKQPGAFLEDAYIKNMRVYFDFYLNNDP